jgi:hypothetical protein
MQGCVAVRMPQTCTQQPTTATNTHLYGCSERVIGCELQVPQPHACNRARAVALGQPPLNAHTVVCVPGCHHDRI